MVEAVELQGHEEQSRKRIEMGKKQNMRWVMYQFCTFKWNFLSVRVLLLLFYFLSVSGVWYSDWDEDSNNVCRLSESYFEFHTLVLLFNCLEREGKWKFWECICIWILVVTQVSRSFVLWFPFISLLFDSTTLLWPAGKWIHSDRRVGGGWGWECNFILVGSCPQS